MRRIPFTIAVRVGLRSMNIPSILGHRFRLLALCTALAACANAEPDAVAVADTTSILSGGTELPHEFTQLLDLVELPDGRLIVNDGKESALLLVDVKNGSRTPLGRKGRGPLEYEMSGDLFSVGDTVVYYDDSQHRFLVISPEARLLRTVPFTPKDTLWRFGLIDLKGLDAAGRLYGQTIFKNPEILEQPVTGIPKMDDTVEIRRIDIRSGHIETIVGIRNFMAQIAPKMEMQGSRMRITFTAPDYRAPDVWTVLPDGRVAVLRNGVYRLELLDGNRVVFTGPVIDALPIPITRAERNEEADSLIAEAERGFKSELGSDSSKAIDVGVIEPRNPAKVKPPYEGIRLSPSGLFWVETPTAGLRGPQRFDVLDSNGVRIWSTVIPKGETLEAVGRRAIYTTRRDADDFYFIRRYALPPSVAR